MSYILAGDVGGTKTALALAVMEGRFPCFLHKKRFESRKAASLEAMIEAFLSEVRIETGETFLSLGVAGPVERGGCRTTNLPWMVDSPAIGKKFGFDGVEIMNDFMAIACGIPFLSGDDLDPLNGGHKEETGPIAVIGAGTGLGEGMAFWCPAEGRYRVVASEGGHADFAPRNDDEAGLLVWLRKKFDHVSFEKVLSGPGLVNIYGYLADTSDFPPNPATEAAMAAGDGAAVIAARGLAGEDPNCARAVDMFVSIYGAETGNLALKCLPTGGLYVAGGIAPKLADRLKGGGFNTAFLAKGRLSSFLERIPVYIIKNTEVALFGAISRAEEIMVEKNQQVRQKEQVL